MAPAVGKAKSNTELLLYDNRKFKSIKVQGLLKSLFSISLVELIRAVNGDKKISPACMNSWKSLLDVLGMVSYAAWKQSSWKPRNTGSLGHKGCLRKNVGVLFMEIIDIRGFLTTVPYMSSLNVI